MIRFIKKKEEIAREDILEAARIWIEDSEYIDLEQVWIRAKLSAAQKFAQEANEKKEKIELPAIYRQYAKVFKERESGKLPQKCPWDHAIVITKIGDNHLG